MQLLEGKKRERVQKMMHGDLLEFNDWEELMLKKYPKTQVLHEQRQNPEWTCSAGTGGELLSRIGDRDGHLRCDERGAETGSLFCALAYFFEQFAHDALLEEYPIGNRQQAIYTYIYIYI